MGHTPKILWGEGLFLRPQHFQQQDDYHEGRLRDVSAALHPYAWGVRKARFDNQSLEHGALRALELSVIFPDGEMYAAPGADELPQPLSLESLPDVSEGTLIHLALPLLKDHGGNCTEADGEDPSARFVQDSQATGDLFTDAGDAELTYLRKTVRLLSDDQPKDPYTTIPVARVIRTSTGGFELDEAYVPPAVNIAAAPALFLQLRRLLDTLQAKSQSLYGMHREPAEDIIEFRSGDIASFWLLHTVNAAFGALSHLFHHADLHPERLHQELLRMIGGLLTFSDAHELSDLPAYNHAAPGDAFDAAFSMIRELLDTVISAKYVPIPLTETKPSYFQGRLDSQRIDESSSLYLAVGADMPGPELVESVPIRFKVGAADDVEECVLAAMPGVTLSHAAQVPSAIPVRPGSHYFAIEPRGEMYDRMIKSGAVVIYVPKGISDLKLELLAIT